MPYPVWLLLGEASALSRAIGQAALPVQEAVEMDGRSLVQSLDALAGLEGNTLSETQVERCLAGELRLPASQAYLGQEILNLQKGIRWTEDRLRAGDRQFTPWSLQLLNAQVLKGLPWDEEVAPGDYRTIRQLHSQGGAPADDIGVLMEHLCDWLSTDRFAPQHLEERMSFGLVRSFLAQLYLLWIRPFADGNLRTAWLATHQLLLEAGLSPVAVNRLVSHTGRARSAWLRECNSAGSGNGDPIPFIAYMSRCLVEALQELVTEIEEHQHKVLMSRQLGQLFSEDSTRNGARRRSLVMALTEQSKPVPARGIPHLSTALAKLYARLDRKTLLRDIQYLQDKRLVEKSTEGIRVVNSQLRPFRPLVPA